MTRGARSILEVKDLTKVMGGKTIVDHLTFDVKEGEVFGFLGPNGSGKTTTIRMLVGLIRPTEGSVRIGGYDVQKEFKQAMKHVGCIVENPELYSFLTGWENLRQFARMIGGVPEERIWEVVHKVNLTQRIHDKVKTYSLGMKQRLGIAQALLGSPRLLILDEPTNGLDPAGIRELRNFVRTLAEEEGISVLVSSHLLGEVQAMCDRVAIIHKGKLVQVAAVEELVRKAAEKVEWTVEPPEEAVKRLREHPHVSEVETPGGNRILCRVASHAVAEVNAHLVRNGISVTGIRPVVVTLEDFFLEWTGGDTGA